MTKAFRYVIAASALAAAPLYAARTRMRTTARVTMGSIPRTTWDSVYTAEQAARGQDTYARTCSRCHQATLGGADQSPPLTGGAFLSSWNGQTLGDLHDRVRTSMPTDDPGTYRRQDISDVIAYVLRFNGYPAGKDELSADDAALKEIVFSSAKP